MRVGKIAWGLGGLGALAVLYFCADFLVLHSSEISSKRLVVAKEDKRPRVRQEAVLVERAPAPRRQQAPAAASQAPALDEPEPERPEPDRAVELATVLEAQYAVDERPTRESIDRESAIESLFSQPELHGKGHLQELNCRETVCRGVVKIDNAQAQNDVFGHTFLSPKFMAKIPDAVTVASRERRSDGSVIATFYIHPQSMAEMVAP